MRTAGGACLKDHQVWMSYTRSIKDIGEIVLEVTSPPMWVWRILQPVMRAVVGPRGRLGLELAAG
jgi:hypothetical protein